MLAYLRVIVNPKYSEIDFETYDQVIVYDIPYSKSRLDLLLSRCKNVTVLYNKQDEEKLNQVINKSIPDRNDLANLYVSIKNGTFSSIESKKDLTILPKFDLGLMILGNLGLVEKDDIETKYSIIDQGSKKINIFDTPIYQDVQDIKNQFDEFRTIAHTKLY